MFWLFVWGSGGGLCLSCLSCCVVSLFLVGKHKDKPENSFFIIFISSHTIFTIYATTLHHFIFSV